VYHKYDASSTTYHILVVADKDTDSKTAEGWTSDLLRGVLQRGEDGNYTVKWDLTPITLLSQLNEGGRGMELSDLVHFNNRLLSFCDRTGIVFQIDAEKGEVTPQQILLDGDGTGSKKFKCEWATVKDDLLYAGGTGKEWTGDEGEIITRGPQWVKIIDLAGGVAHRNWEKVYNALRTATGTSFPGYMVHEAVRFHPVQRRWYFLPRRASTEKYDATEDEKRGVNWIISTDEEFGDIKVWKVGPIIETHGFSAFVFLPGRENEVVALKTVEWGSVVETYITVFNLDGTILLEETKINDTKFEGIEVV